MWWCGVGADGNGRVYTLNTVGKGTDCGVSLADFSDVRAGDVLQCVHFVKRKAEVVKIASGGARVMDDKDKSRSSD